MLRFPLLARKQCQGAEPVSVWNFLRRDLCRLDQQGQGPLHQERDAAYHGEKQEN